MDALAKEVVESLDIEATFEKMIPHPLAFKTVSYKESQIFYSLPSNPKMITDNNLQDYWIENG